jgi:hypothetical protein
MSRCFDSLFMVYGMAALLITRMDLTSAELRAEAARSRNAKASRHMLAIAMALDGHSREMAAMENNPRLLKRLLVKARCSAPEELSRHGPFGLKMAALAEHR